MNFTELIEDMKAATEFLASLPVNKQFTDEQLTQIDTVRLEARRLFDEATATIETFQGE